MQFESRDNSVLWCQIVPKLLGTEASHKVSGSLRKCCNWVYQCLSVCARVCLDCFF